MTDSPTSIAQPETPILIVDDNLQYSAVLEKMLSNGFGYQDITVCHDPEDGYKAIMANPEKYRLLFIDYHFPSGDTGGNFMKRLRDEGLLEGKIAFLITSDPTIENTREALEAGALGVVAKPFDRNALIAQLEKAERVLITEGMDSF